jgi:hypothetical protein
MRKAKTFVSFDFHNDQDLLRRLVAESQDPDSPFQIEDWSIHEDLSGDWEKKVRARMREMDLLIVICGEHTETAMGVTAEFWMAQEEHVRYFLLSGRADRQCQRPSGAKPHDVLYEWTWTNIKALVLGSR